MAIPDFVAYKIRDSCFVSLFTQGTCKNAGIEPRAWMEDVLKQIPYYLRDGRYLTELLPRA